MWQSIACLRIVHVQVLDQINNDSSFIHILLFFTLYLIVIAMILHRLLLMRPKGSYKQLNHRVCMLYSTLSMFAHSCRLFCQVFHLGVTL